MTSIDGTSTETSAPSDTRGVFTERVPKIAGTPGGASPIGRSGPSAHRAVSKERSKQMSFDIAGYAFSLPFLVIYVLFMLWPIVLGLRMSLFNWSLLGTGTSQ